MVVWRYTRGVIHSLTGTIIKRADTAAVVRCGGVGYLVHLGARTLGDLPPAGEEVTLYTHLAVKEDAHELYGFLDEHALALFELLITVSGVGPKTALGVLDLDTVPNVMAAILTRRADLLMRASGIGKKTAERIILELQSRMALAGAEERAKTMDASREAEEALVTLGYPRAEARRALEAIEAPADATAEALLRAALKSLGKR